MKKLFWMESQFAEIPEFQNTILQSAVFFLSSVACYYCFYMEVGKSTTVCKDFHDT